MRSADALEARRRWTAIAVATAVLVPAFWALLVGAVAEASDDGSAGLTVVGLAVGLCVVPFVFVALAFLSRHPDAPMAVVRAMGLFVVVGLVVSAFALEPVTGIVAGIGAGGVVALRRGESEPLRPRVLGVVVASAYAFVLAHALGAGVLVMAPVLPLTALGVADHLGSWLRDRSSVAGSTSRAH